MIRKIIALVLFALFFVYVGSYCFMRLFSPYMVIEKDSERIYAFILCGGRYEQTIKVFFSPLIWGEDALSERKYYDDVQALRQVSHEGLQGWRVVEQRVGFGGVVERYQSRNRVIEERGQPKE